jgi:hypothetical protein
MSKEKFTDNDTEKWWAMGTCTPVYPGNKKIKIFQTSIITQWDRNLNIYDFVIINLILLFIIILTSLDTDFSVYFTGRPELDCGLPNLDTLSMATDLIAALRLMCVTTTNAM